LFDEWKLIVSDFSEPLLEQRVYLVAITQTIMYEYISFEGSGKSIITTCIYLYIYKEVGVVYVHVTSIPPWAAELSCVVPDGCSCISSVQ
jgi:hypothetical protein